MTARDVIARPLYRVLLDGPVIGVIGLGAFVAAPISDLVPRPWSAITAVIVAVAVGGTAWRVLTYWAPHDRRTGMDVLIELSEALADWAGWPRVDHGPKHAHIDHTHGGTT
ncbi:hypothetical protein [Streptomyces sp. SID3343]|uniref:hypothetical protein n=1 Tax=Streptomyces sp. SID3343 TaxID=2690260 RepID=UPI00136DBABC|nr:hypothetical protein [Streptomyces sp. SID3343]MYW00049.1 hypothetical protein [Streptomyces sp. SID3343]